MEGERVDDVPVPVVALENRREGCLERAAVEEAEGEKQSNIIRAQGEKQSQILEAQGDAISTVLRAKSAESMGERAIIDKGMETLENIGQGDSATFILPQEMSSLLGRYGKHLTGSDVTEMAKENGEGELDSLDFDAETREMLGLDDIERILGEIDKEADVDVESMEQEAEAIKMGEDPENIQDPDEVIDQMDAEMDPSGSPVGGPGSDGGDAGNESGADRERETETE